MARREKENVEYTRSTTAKGMRAFGTAGLIGGGAAGFLSSVPFSLPVGVGGAALALVGLAWSPLLVPGLIAVGVAASVSLASTVVGALYGTAIGGVGGGALGAVWGGVKRLFGFAPEQVKQREFDAKLEQAEALGRAHARQAIGMQMAGAGQEMGAEPKQLSPKIQDILDRGPNRNMAEAVSVEKSEEARGRA